VGIAWDTGALIFIGRDGRTASGLKILEGAVPISFFGNFMFRTCSSNRRCNSLLILMQLLLERAVLIMGVSLLSRMYI
jgi:hypothetical protein